MTITLIVSSAVLLVLGSRFAPRLQNVRAARWLTAGAFVFGGLLVHTGRIVIIAGEGAYCRILTLFMPV